MHNTRHASRDLPLWWVCVLAVGFGFLFISGDSLWIDEGNAAYKALQPDFSTWWHALVTEGGSDAQMPLYMFWIWIWEKMAGSSEWALRLSNLPWLVITAICLHRFRFGALFVLCSAFVLYYANELRPYLMQIAASALVVSGIRQLDQLKGWPQTLAGCLLLCGSSLTGVLWAGGILLGIIMDQPARLRQRWFWSGIAISSPCFLLLGAYYLRSLMLGQQAASMGGGLVTSIGAVTYELLGLLGLGPSRVELREDPRSVLPYLILLVPMALTVCAATCIGACTYFKAYSWKRRLAVLLAIALPCLTFLALLFLKDFRVLGRHLAPLSVLIALCIARALTLRHDSTLYLRASRTLGCGAIAFSLASAANLRFNDRHARDDYKGAAQIAHQEIIGQKPVIWAADKRTSEYYGIHGNLEWCRFWRHGVDPLPDLLGNETVIISKPDIYDPGNAFANTLKARGFRPVKQLRAFTIWQIP